MGFHRVFFQRLLHEFLQEFLEYLQDIPLWILLGVLSGILPGVTSALLLEVSSRIPPMTSSAFSLGIPSGHAPGIF